MNSYLSQFPGCVQAVSPTIGQCVQHYCFSHDVLVLWSLAADTAKWSLKTDFYLLFENFLDIVDIFVLENVIDS